MASATSSPAARTERRTASARIPEARALEAPLRALARGRKAAPLLYLEMTGVDGPGPAPDAGHRRACVRAASTALRAAAGSVLRRRDVVVSGPGARWFAALLVDRAVAAQQRAAVTDVDLVVAANRLRAAVQHALDQSRSRGDVQTKIGVRVGWTIIEPRDGDRPLAELRHALRGAAVVARVEERRAIVLAAITHELRTPLTSIIGFVERLAEDPKQSAAQRSRALTIIGDESRRLARLVEGLIDAGSWQAGKLTLRRHPVHMRTLVDRAVRAVAEAAKARGVRIATRGDARAVVDEDRLTQVMVNLLDNAVRHARSRGKVRVAVSGARGALKVTIADDGKGIDPEVIQSMGAPFAVGPNGRVGLGIAISNMLVDAHGGSIEFGRGRDGGAEVMVKIKR
jgi:signal transduction histidine kinase